MTDKEDQARRKDDARPNEQLQWGKHDARHGADKLVHEYIGALLANDCEGAAKATSAMAAYVMSPPAAHPADAGAVAVEQANDMRIALVVQLNELIDLGDRYARRMKQADPDESAYAQGAIDYARRVMAPYNYNGPLRAPCLARQPQATPLEATSEQMGGAQVAQDRQQRSRELDDRYRKGYSEGWTEGRSDLADRAAEGEATSERKPGDLVTSPSQWKAVADQLNQLDKMLAEARITDKHRSRQFLYRILHDVCGMPAAPSERKPLTDERIAAIADRTGFMAKADVLSNLVGGDICLDFARAIEQHHGIGGGK